LGEAYTSSTANPQASEVMDYKKDFEDGKAVTSLGGLHYKHHNGEGKTLIFLHGLGATTLSWSKLVALLPYGMNVYLVDLLGHGESDAPQIDYTIKNQALAINNFIKGEALREVYIIGHSYGGWIGAYYASQYQLRGLILEDSAGLKEGFDQIVAVRRVQEYKAAFFKSAMQLNNNKDYVIKSILEADFKEEELDDAILGKITVPTLIIWGRRDILLNAEMGNILQKKIKNSKIRFIEDAGHEPHASHPDEVVAKIIDFISFS
jgi:pimeloyl-ACP methyl ester carboxylesterase